MIFVVSRPHFSKQSHASQGEMYDTMNNLNLEILDTFTMFSICKSFILCCNIYAFHVLICDYLLFNAILICFVSVGFVSFRLVSFRFGVVSFRFVSIGSVSFRSVPFRFVSFWFRFALYRDPLRRWDIRGSR